MITTKAEVNVAVFGNLTKEFVYKFKERMVAAHRRGVEDGVNILKKILGAKKYMDTGKLQGSVTNYLFKKATDSFSGTVEFTKPGIDYVYYVEHGRGPGKPPPYQTMVEWGKRKGMSIQKSLAIRNKIALYGTKARPFMDDATYRIHRNYEAVIRAEAAKKIIGS